MVMTFYKLFKRKRSIERVPLDELRREKIRLDQEEAKLAHRITEIESKKQTLFQRGKDEPSQLQQMLIARKIKEMDVQAKNLDKNMRLFSRQLRIVNGFIQVKENHRLLKEAGLGHLINKMDMEKLQRYVEQATIDGHFQMDKLTEVLSRLEEIDHLTQDFQEDSDILAIVEAMQEARAAVEAQPEEALEQGMKKVNELLKREKVEQEELV